MPLKWSFNGEAVFSGLDADGDIGLWVTNGTAAGTHELTGINGANPGGLFSGYFPAFTVFNGEVDSRPLARRGCSLSASQSIGLPAVDQAARDHGGVSTTLRRIEPGRPLGRMLASEILPRIRPELRPHVHRRAQRNAAIEN